MLIMDRENESSSRCIILYWQINGKTAVFTEEFRSGSWVQNMNQYSHI